MPLSVPLVLVPGHPDRVYTVHTHRTAWDNAKLFQHEQWGAELRRAAREGLRFVSECIAAELADADVEVTTYPGGATAVARVLCGSEVCAAVAEQYRRDADEDAEAEAARTWAATQLQDQTVQLLRLRGELEKTTPGKTPDTPADTLAAGLAAQAERTGGSTAHIMIMMDEAAALFQDNGLFPDRPPEGVRAAIDRLIRLNRVPVDRILRYEDLGISPESPRSADTWASPPDGSAVAPDGAQALAGLYAADMAPQELVRGAETLARLVAAGEPGRADVLRLAEVCRELARRCERDDDSGHALMRRTDCRPRAVAAGEVRTALAEAGQDQTLRTLPAILPEDDDVLVLVYREPTAGLALLEAVRAGDDEATRQSVAGLLESLTTGKDRP